MSKLNLTTAFARYHAKLVNPQWAVSAISNNDELVVSCWKNYLKPSDGTLRYTDALSRWAGNKLGNKLFRDHLEQAMAEEMPVRLVMASSSDWMVIDSGQSGAGTNNSFSVREDLVGTVASFDGDEFVIEFVLSGV